MTKNLYIMRHGQTIFNERGKMQGWSDAPLTDKGIAQAKIAGKYFKDNDIHFDAAYSSSSERATDTLELVTDMPYERRKGLREMYFGLFEGENKDLNPLNSRYELFYDAFVQYGGEDMVDVQKRVTKELIDIMNNDNDNVLVVSHYVSILAFTNQWYDSVKVLKSGFTNCSIIKFSFDDDKFKLEEIINHDYSDLDK
ncbi:histidine phosphatase family protein [Companilactobacillus mishanensis]|uniref:Histidine phosphatase family protein n=1 Tax=Companilactobacillus mishanensis TaxID=2486008 RepID=A0ABW9P4R4_9LACO|nr:histidine phosphatase family protein [Companilactobacillus mishanensis]MQS44102.1 histidine phosphatase family protein [Companilactobacillus mishanensis]MQS88402.1 histidine phosphatase family protein [Companilactobacillus mishanensis]